MCAYCIKTLPVETIPESITDDFAGAAAGIVFLPMAATSNTK
jgi:hypothetical protein